MTALDERQSAPPQLHQVTDAMRLPRMSRSATYQLIRCGRPRPAREGRARLISVSASAGHIALPEREAEEAGR